MGLSWSGVRKILEQDFLCPALQGRVQYFCTHYHSAPDQYGRVCLRVDGKEYAKGNPYSYYVNSYHIMERQLKTEQSILCREWADGRFLYEEENAAAGTSQGGIRAERRPGRLLSKSSFIVRIPPGWR